MVSLPAVEWRCLTILLLSFSPLFGQLVGYAQRIWRDLDVSDWVHNLMVCCKRDHAMFERIHDGQWQIEHYDRLLDCVKTGSSRELANVGETSKGRFVALVGHW